MKTDKFLAILSKNAVWLIMAIFAVIFYATFIANHYYFRSYSLDYGVYNFIFWDYAHLHNSMVPIDYVLGMREAFLQEHFSFILIYFVPVYWLLNWLTGSYTLMIIQVTMILCSAWASYKLIKLKTNDEWLATLSVLYYFLLQGHYSSFNSDCNIYTLAFCLIPLFLLCFEVRKYGIAFILFILFLFSREDMPLYFIFIFIVLIIWHRKEKRIVAYCVSGIIVSIGCFALFFKVLIPMVETSKVHYALFQYAALGNTPWEAFLHCIEHPIDTFKLLYQNQLPDHTYDGVKKEFYTVYLISGGFLLLFRPQYFIWFIPILAQKMFNDAPIRWGIIGYYCDGVITLLPISVFLIISIIKIKWIRYSSALLVCILALSVTVYKMNVNNQAVWDDTSKDNIFASGFFHSEYNMKKIHEELKLIPANAKVCASSSLIPHLSQRKDIYEYPDVEDAEYIAVFAYRDFYLMSENAYKEVLNYYIFNPSWDIIAYEPPLLLMKKSTHPSKRVISDTIKCDAETISADKKHFIASNGDMFNNTDARDSAIKHSGKYSICLNKNKQFGFTYHTTGFKRGDLVKITVWKYPAYSDTGNLVASNSQGFYQSISAGSEKDSTGWVKLTTYLIMPKDNLDIYMWNRTDKNVWFDDLRIVRCSVK